MADISTLLEIMARLRDPQGGCPWDREQTFGTIAPYTVEEAYEVADAIERGDLAKLRDELGDLLFQVVYHAQMAREQGAFQFGDVVAAIADKLVRRHPHVFGDARIDDARAQTVAWEKQKTAERAGALLADVPRALPALRRADKLTKRAASVGFDWPDAQAVRAKVTEELAELDAEIVRGGAGDDVRERLADELGDVLFAVANLARHLHVDPEQALQQANARFTRRFEHIERRLAASGRTLESAGLEEMDRLWDEAKAAERETGA
jgi:tetrapyrrole methylase family protein/MazG family protein/ATP diphosphatase